MLTFFFGAFGLSTLWLIPLIWRALRALVAKGRKRPVGGEGTIRYALGGLLVLLASATLEGLLVAHYTDDPSAGGAVCRVLASGLGSVFGAALTALLMLAILAVALRWYPGVSWRAPIWRRLACLRSRSLPARSPLQRKKFLQKRKRARWPVAEAAPRRDRAGCMRPSWLRRP